MRGKASSPRNSPRFDFVGIDGEGIKTASGDRYVLLQADGAPPIVNLNGLGTAEILDWLFSVTDKSTALVGYGFNYDFECWLGDLAPLEYTNLVNGWAIFFPDGNDGGGYTLKYIPRKILKIFQGDHTDGYGELFNRKGERRSVYNVIGFFQQSFVRALESFGLSHLITAEIEQGKAARGTFTADDLPMLIEYNAQECRALSLLMRRFWDQCLDGFGFANVEIALKKTDCYGPGAFAAKFLKMVDWKSSYKAIKYRSAPFVHVLNAHLLRGADALERDDCNRLLIKHYPFAASYFGGRIELAAVGWWPKAYSYDIASAYPAAMVRMPIWSSATYSESARTIRFFRERRDAGMVLARWSFPERWQWYPFPFRSWSKNVYYPREGYGWIMSPEYYAALDTGLDAYIEIEAVYALKGTAHTGDGLTINTRTAAAAEIQKFYDLRRQFKRSDDPIARGAQLPLKLTLNSCYGKILQQIGATIEEPRYFNDIAASWITSWTRAMIWRAIASAARDDSIIAVQTDGIYASRPLDLPLSSDLGGWEANEIFELTKLLPGIYEYMDTDGIHTRQRGQTRYFSHEEAKRVLFGERRDYRYTFPAFVGQRHAIAQPLKFGPHRLQWVDIEKEFKADLSSKRSSPHNIVIPRGTHKFYRPKKNQYPELISRPFSLKFGATPYLNELEESLIEDCRDEDGLLVAGIQE